MRAWLCAESAQTRSTGAVHPYASAGLLPEPSSELPGLSWQAAPPASQAYLHHHQRCISGVIQQDLIQPHLPKGLEPGKVGWSLAKPLTAADPRQAHLGMSYSSYLRMDSPAQGKTGALMTTEHQVHLLQEAFLGHSLPDLLTVMVGR